MKQREDDGGLTEEEMRKEEKEGGYRRKGGEVVKITVSQYERPCGDVSNVRHVSNLGVQRCLRIADLSSVMFCSSSNMESFVAHL